MNQRFELISNLSQYEKKVLRQNGIYYDRRSKLYAAGYGQDVHDAVRHAMLQMRHTFNVRYTHVDDSGRECPCFSANHARD